MKLKKYKKCKTCNDVKSVEKFYSCKPNRSKDGYSYDCKECEKERSRACYRLKVLNQVLDKLRKVS